MRSGTLGWGGRGSGKCGVILGLLKVEVAELADGVCMSPRDESRMTVRSSLASLGEWSWNLMKGECLRGEVGRN